MYVAAFNGHFDISKLLVDHGAEVNMVTRPGLTPLTIAAYWKHYKVCKNLMLYASNVDYSKVGKYYGDLLCLLSHHGDMVLIQKLVQNIPQADVNMKNRDGRTALNEAGEQEYFDVFKYLIYNGAKVTNDAEVSCLYNICNTSAIDLTKLGANYTDLLCHCSLLGDLGLCQQLIQSNPEVELNGKNRQNKTALNVAAEEEQYDVLEYLLNQGATWEDINKPIKDQFTPLYFVCRSGLLDWVTKFVQEYKADINGMGCLQASIEYYHTQVAEYLIKSGCKINQVICNYFCI